MKLFPNLVTAVSQALFEIFQQQQYADKVIERTLKSNPRWGARDRGFIAESVYEIVRYKRLLETVSEITPTTPADYARIFGVWRLMRGQTLPDWYEFEGLDAEVLERRFQAVRQDRRILEAIPDWLDEVGSQELGDRWPGVLHALNEPAPVVLRVNTLKADRKTVQEALEAEGIETETTGSHGLVLRRRQQVFRTRAFMDGWFEMQDAASQLVAPMLDVRPGMRVVDACAGAGGKTLHIAALMENKGSLIALDTEEWKLQELKKRARRAGVFIIEPRPITSNKVIKRLHGSADRVLLDVPCSGLGVLRRNPDAKWKLTPAFLDQVRAWQQDILREYSLICKPGGRLVYATCSILPSENQLQVQQFLARHGDTFTLKSEKIILPDESGYDGFYIAALERTGEAPTLSA
ncbi:MAG: class I SAM-dependent methyltransferase [Bacteroidia bacterium]|nr:class I SAM-dependent methyltransferase [Bacteroidia bacterium]